jgi:hypothetical protein
VSLYAAQMGSIPTTITLVTVSSSNAQGQTSGAFLAAIPAPPSGWATAYVYTTAADGTFTISATGDSTTARVP